MGHSDTYQAAKAEWPFNSATSTGEFLERKFRGHKHASSGVGILDVL